MNSRNRTVKKQGNIIGYHYCSIPTFLNILKGKSFYMSNPMYMSDKMELKWFLNMIISEFEKTYTGKHRPELIPVFKGRCEQVKAYLEENGQDNLFITCFSQRNDILSQWRKYADNEKGVAIGVNLGGIAEQCKNVNVTKVKYCEALCRNDLEKAVDYIGDVDVYANVNEKCQMVYDSDVEFLTNLFLWIMPKYKKYSFKNENEIRLLYSRNIYFNDTGNDLGICYNMYDSMDLDTKYRYGDTSELIEYVELEINPDMFIDVCLGPKCELSESEVNALVEKALERNINIYRFS